ncbi:MAG: glucose-6-phosphate isomerase [Bradymonadia bacterium]|jgi:glucose-6-phosphate isomerase
MLAYDYSLSTKETLGNGGLTPTFDTRVARGVADFATLYRRPSLSYAASVDQSLEDVLAVADEIREKFTDLVVIGIGGSALGSKAIYHSLVRPVSGKMRSGADRHGVRLHFVENVDPLDLIDILDGLSLETTAFNVITKSGGTVETMSNFFAARERLITDFGMAGYRERMFATTDPSAGILRKLVEDDGLRSLPVPSGVGGRFSVFTAVGLLPLAAAGLDISAFVSGAAKARDAALSESLETNPAASFAALQIGLYEAGVHDVVLMPYVTGMRDVANWFVQLWAESLGKPRGDGAVGPTPIPAVGATDQHSQLQLFMEGPATKNVVFCSVVLDDDDFVVPEAPEACSSLEHLSGKTMTQIRSAELDGVQAALQEVGRPSSRFELQRLDEASIGALMMTLCAATGIAGSILGVNPYDQPGVELAKKFAHGILGRPAENEFAERLEASRAALVTVKSTIS